MKICKYCKREINNSCFVFIKKTKKGEKIYTCKNCDNKRQKLEIIERINKRL